MVTDRGWWGAIARSLQRTKGRTQARVRDPVTDRPSGVLSIGPGVEPDTASESPPRTAQYPSLAPVATRADVEPESPEAGSTESIPRFAVVLASVAVVIGVTAYAIRATPPASVGAGPPAAQGQYAAGAEGPFQDEHQRLREFLGEPQAQWIRRRAPQAPATAAPAVVVEMKAPDTAHEGEFDLFRVTGLLDEGEREATGCFERGSVHRATVAVVFQPSGVIVEATVEEPEDLDAATAQCVENAFLGLQGPRFTGQDAIVWHALRFR